MQDSDLQKKTSSKVQQGKPIARIRSKNVITSISPAIYLWVDERKRGEIMATAAQVILAIGVSIAGVFAIIGFAPNFRDKK